MKKLLLVVLLFSTLANAQSKRKKRLAEEKASQELVANLQAHVKYLADDKLEGRRTGTKGEQLALAYIVQQYQQIGLQPKGKDGYVQTFEINEGKQFTSATSLVINGHALEQKTEYFPLTYSAQKSVKGNPAMALNEKGQPWFKDLKEVLEENKTNPHFDIDETIRKEAEAIKAKGATALFLYNSSAITDNVQFNKNDTSKQVEIPVIYITKAGYKHYFFDNAASLDLAVNVQIAEQKRSASNIIGYIDNHAANTIILGAHYDHLGYGEDKNALDTGHIIHNGADDNASGTAALIELAKILVKSSPKNNNYLIIHFSGEELGLFGSKHWIDDPTINITANYMLNMDMVGRYDTSHKLTIGGYGTSPTWGEYFASVNNPQILVKFDSSGSGPSDHASFYRKDMPVLFFFTGSHPDYHKATDDWDKINYDGEKNIVQMIHQLIIANDTKGKLVFTKTREAAAGRNNKLKVTLGVIPDYGYSGTGMRIDGVSPGKIAEKIGLQAGDVLLQLGDMKFVDVRSYMDALGKFDKGDKTKLRILRGKEEKTFDIEL
ncbi:MAG: M28 family peptidase [Bacteroidetes bacterium]|nr:M28 family peptidase [Bacteroidota bacterium]